MKHPHLILAAILLLPHHLLAWGEPHHAITRAAVSVLSDAEKQQLGNEAKALADSYCLIPDNVYSDKANAKYAAMESHPGVAYLQFLHLPTTQAEYGEVTRYFMEKAVTALREGRLTDAAKFMGTLCHQIEDYGSPSHTMPGDNQFTLLQQFLPPTERMKDQLMHPANENGTFAVSIDGYTPRLLGTSVEEAAWRLMHRMNEGIINARSTTIPIMQAHYAGDLDAVVKHQLRAATVDAQIVADALHTMLCLGAQKYDAKGEESLQRVSLSTFWPTEAVNLHFPQTQFFGAPYWGYPRAGVILEKGVKAMPLKLRLADGEKVFADGLSAGMGRTLTFLLPKSVFTRFTVIAGLHPELGAKGRVEFTINGDGKPLKSVTLAGGDAAQTIECDITGVKELQLALASRTSESKSNYAIWAEPSLLKK